MKIYTKTGDKGTTSLYKIGRVSKTDVRITVTGELDELNANLGFLIVGIDEGNTEQKLLHRVQDRLFRIGAKVAASEPGVDIELPELTEKEVFLIEQHIDHLQEELPEQKYFILPGGGEASARAHLARTVCRRAERSFVALHEEIPQPEAALHYLNRLSDYLFVLARYLAFREGKEETYWIP